jgi:hypothetical protein
MTTPQKLGLAAIIAIVPLVIAARVHHLSQQGKFPDFAEVIASAIYVYGLSELSRHLLKQPRASTAREVARAFVIALPFMIVAVGASSVIDRHVAGGWLPRWRSPTTPDLPDHLVVGLPLAGIAFLIILVIRVRAARQEDA